MNPSGRQPGVPLADCLLKAVPRDPDAGAEQEARGGRVRLLSVAPGIVATPMQAEIRETIRRVYAPRMPFAFGLAVIALFVCAWRGWLPGIRPPEGARRRYADHLRSRHPGRHVDLVRTSRVGRLRLRVARRRQPPLAAADEPRSRSSRSVRHHRQPDHRGEVGAQDDPIEGRHSGSIAYGCTLTR